MPVSAIITNISCLDSLPLPDSSPLPKPVSRSSIAAASSYPQTDHQHIWLVTGPAGCGKSTVGEHIAHAMEFPFIEGDMFHPKANVDKMEAGIPLTDADRWDWLTILREEAIKNVKAGSPGVVLACSALKRKYRDVIRVAPYFDPAIQLHFIYLRASEAMLQARVAARTNHYMHANMVHSQFTALEEPKDDETDVFIIDVNGAVEEVEKQALEMVRKLVKLELEKDAE